MNTITLTSFNECYWNRNADKWGFDNKVRPDHILNGQWDELVNSFPKHHAVSNKVLTPMFNLSQYCELDETEDKVEDNRTKQEYVRKCEPNVRVITALILDYENPKYTINQFIEDHKQYDFLLHTSFGHLTEGKNHAECFRVILRIDQPIPVNDYREIVPTLSQHFKFIDQTTFDLSRAFFFPSCSADMLNKAVFTINNGGQAFNWNYLERVKYVPFVFEPVKHTGVVGGTGKILYDTLNMYSFCVDQGLNPKKVTDGFFEVDCPFGDEHSGKDRRGAFIKGASFHCKHSHKKNTSQFKEYFKQQIGEDCFRAYCETDDTLTANLDPIAEAVKKRQQNKGKTEKRIKPTKKMNHEQLLKLIKFEEGEVVVDAYSRAKRQQMLEKALKNLKQRNIFLAAEGFGKSYGVAMHAKKGYRIIFACESNQQAVDQGKDFEKHNLKTQIITSRKYKLEQMGVEVVLRPPSSPWDNGAPDDKLTKENLKVKLQLKTDEEVDDLWNDLAPEQPDFERFEIVCTTINRVQAWGRMQKGKLTSELIVQHDTIIVLDDPNANMFMKLYDFNNKWVDKKVNGELLKQIEIDGFRYFVRPESLTIGFGFDTCKIIVTTTENLTAFLAAKILNVEELPDLMTADKLDGGEIHVLSSEIVRAKKDGFLPCIVERLRKEGFDGLEYIADGQGNRLNLTNNRGRNDLKGLETIVEISYPPIDRVRLVCHELGENLNRDFETKIRTIITVDLAQQAAGRNMGYRNSDGKFDKVPKCVVLIEPKLLKPFLKEFRYGVTSAKRIEVVGRSENIKGDGIEGAVEWYVRNIDQYVMDRRYRKIKGDLKTVLEKIEPSRRDKFTNRFNKAVKNFIGDRLWTGVEEEWLNSLFVQDGG